MMLALNAHRDVDELDQPPPPWWQFVLAALVALVVLALSLLGGCWPNQPEPRTVIREVLTYRYIHDVPRECKGLPEFPAVSELGDQTHFVSTWVQQLDAWVQAAGACLDVRTYHITDLVEEKRP